MSSKEYKAEWARRYRQRNPEKMREYYKRDYLRHRDRCIASSKQYYQEHRIEIRARIAKKQKQAKLEALTHYSVGNIPQCVRCRIVDIDVLCIDHIDGEGNKHRRSLGNESGSNFYYWLIKNNFPSGYQTLCCNCNVKKRLAEGK